jgi:hypothetical protein
MILIDDQLLVSVVGGLDIPEPVISSRLATTYGYQYRALRAVRNDQRNGAISRHASPVGIDQLRVRVLHPQPFCAVLNPSDTIGLAVTFSLDHTPFNLLQAELLAAATYHDITDIYLYAVSPHVAEIASSLGIGVHLIN